MIKAANFYLQNNFSVIPCNNKVPTIPSWKQFQESSMSLENAAKVFEKAPQIAIITGKVSLGLELLDFDLKNFPESQRLTFWDSFTNMLLEANPALIRKLQINKTISGGYHVIYRSELVEGNKKLAKIKIGEKFVCIIETRGEGGYFIAPPSPGYECVNGDMTNIPVLEIDERELLINICKSFNQEPPPPIKELKKFNKADASFKKSPMEAYNEANDILNILANYGWEFVFDKGERSFYRRPGSTNTQSANWHSGRKLFYVFSTGDQFLEGGKAYSPSQIFNILECNGDWKITYHSLLEAGYGEKWNGSDLEVIEKLKSKKSLLSADGIISEVKKLRPDWLDTQIEKVLKIVTQKEIERFWFIDDKDKVCVDNLAFNEFLFDELGYCLYSDSNEPKKPLIKLYRESHKVERIRTNDQVKSDVQNWLQENVDEDSACSVDDIIKSLMAKSDKLFAEKNYEWLPSKSFKTFTDDLENAYFFFKNGIVNVKKNDIKLLEYTSLPDNHYIWIDRIRNKDFDIKILSLDQSIYLQSSWAKFIRRISAILPDQDEMTISEITEKEGNNNKAIRFYANMTAMGYMLHSYKDQARPWAIIVQEDTPMDGLGGGSGKQIITKGLQVLRNVLEEDGKQLDVTKQFAFQGITEQTDIYCLDDVKKHFKIEPIYRMITNDMVIEIRNVGRKVIPFNQSPKLMFTTNYDLLGAGNARHLSRRIRMLLVHCYFGDQLTPKDELGMLLGSDWDDTQWQLFFNFMFNCVALYLDRGIVEIEITQDMRIKQIRQNYSDDFFDFMENFSFSEDEVYVAKDLFESFITEFNLDKRMFNYHKFRKGIVDYCLFFDIDIELLRDFRDRSNTDFDRKIDKQLVYKFKKNTENAPF